MHALEVEKDQSVFPEVCSIGDRSVVGLFSGGTLCAEAQIVFLEGGSEKMTMLLNICFKMSGCLCKSIPWKILSR